MIFIVYGYCCGFLLDGGYEVSAITEKGVTLATMTASSEKNGRILLGMSNDERTHHTAKMHELYRNNAPQGSLVFCVWIPFHQTHEHKGLQKALRRRFADDIRFN